MQAQSVTILEEDFAGTLNNSVSGTPFTPGGRLINTISPDTGSGSWTTLAAASHAPQTYFGGGRLFIDVADPEAGAAGNFARGTFTSNLSAGDIVTISGTAGGLTGAGGSAKGIYIGFLSSSSTSPIPQNSGGASPGVYFRDDGTSVLYQGTGTNILLDTFTTPTSEFTYDLIWDTGASTIALSVNGTEVIAATGFTPFFEATTIDSIGIGFRELSYDNSDSGVLGSGAYHKGITVSVIPEPSSFALLAGSLAMASVMIRRRKQI